MANGKKRSRRNKNTSAPILQYTVTVGHESSECDLCCLPSPVLYDFPDGSTLCQLCSGSDGGDRYLYRMAVLGGLYGGWGDGGW